MYSENRKQAVTKLFIFADFDENNKAKYIVTRLDL
jgi:hypothetical protein